MSSRFPTAGGVTLPFSARPIRTDSGIMYGSKGLGLVYTDDHSMSGFTSDGYKTKQHNDKTIFLCLLIAGTVLTLRYKLRAGSIKIMHYYERAPVRCSQ